MSSCWAWVCQSSKVDWGGARAAAKVGSDGVTYWGAKWLRMQGFSGEMTKRPQQLDLRLDNSGMGRKSRDQTIAPGQPNHLVTRGNNRRRLFSYPHERLTFLRILGKNLERTECQLHSICLMTNHVHLLSTPPSVEAASELMRLTLHRYAQIRNAARSGSGKLFERPFYSEPILTIAQLAGTQMYIESNPLRAGIAEDPADCPWSSYSIFAGDPTKSKIPQDLLTPSSWYAQLAGFAGERASAYRRAFAEYVARHARPKHAASLQAYEAASQAYGGRVRRPDGTSARYSASHLQ
jgi:putative transposase